MYGDVLSFFSRRREDPPDSYFSLLHGVDNVPDALSEIWGEIIGANDVLQEYETKSEE